MPANSPRGGPARSGIVQWVGKEEEDGRNLRGYVGGGLLHRPEGRGGMYGLGLCRTVRNDDVRRVRIGSERIDCFTVRRREAGCMV
jgi:hypothetical protein